ncbi:MAG TPA: primosomal protein N' [Gammaproteobacteria bacterium]|nr:primosomal protein N' [Gammaproteobacteria bacterium]
MTLSESSDRLAREPILRVAVPAPLQGAFDYLPPADCDRAILRPGVRLLIPFGRSRRVGILLEVATGSEVAPQRLKRALQVLDTEPALPADILALAAWASRYYHHPEGEALATALPVLLRQGRSGRQTTLRHWRLTDQGGAVDTAALRSRAPRQAELLERLRDTPEGLPGSALNADRSTPAAATLRAMLAKGWVERAPRPSLSPPRTADPETPPALSDAQQNAVTAVVDSLGRFAAFLLEGVTGSGKTEVYLRVIAAALARDGSQALVLVPEIGLTPQLVTRFARRFALPLAVLHSGLSDGERLQAWEAARSGEARIVIGTRSAVFTPLRKPAVFIVDEEHDASLKQQEGLRYSARDLLVLRAQRAAVPVLLGSATPALESLHNARQGRYHLLPLPQRAGQAETPRIELLDVRHQPMEDHLSAPLLARIGRHLAADGQVLLFLNRRGFAPTLLCHECGWVAECRRCDAHMTLHQGSRQLRCHHCGSQRPVDRQCPQCGSTDLRALGSGTERIEQALRRHFPDQTLVRIDRDTTRRKGELQELLTRARAGEGRILLGTQMIAKGHHFPDVTLVAILDADQGLFGADFRASERMAQLIVQVAGRAGRANRPGEVVVQTHHPDHPLLRLLVTDGYPAFAAAALDERRAARLPPYACLALLRAESPDREAPNDFLDHARELAEALAVPGVELWGPVPAPMERRAGRFRAQLMVQAEERAVLHRLLDGWLTTLKSDKSSRRVRWSLDVDPVDTL